MKSFVIDKGAHQYMRFGHESAEHALVSFIGGGLVKHRLFCAHLGCVCTGCVLCDPDDDSIVPEKSVTQPTHPPR